MKKIPDFIDNTPITKFISSTLIMAMAVMMTANVVFRYFFNFSLNWGDEILRYMCVYMAFFGTAATFRYAGHVGVNIFVEKVLPEKTRKYVRLFSDLVTIIFLLIATYYGFILVERIMASGQSSAALGLPLYFVYGVVPVSCILSIIHVLMQIFRHKTYLYVREDVIDIESDEVKL